MVATLARRRCTAPAEGTEPLDSEQLREWADDEEAVMALLTDD